MLRKNPRARKLSRSRVERHSAEIIEAARIARDAMLSICGCDHERAKSLFREAGIAALDHIEALAQQCRTSSLHRPDGA
jgi:hypothetical protein